MHMRCIQTQYLHLYKLTRWSLILLHTSVSCNRLNCLSINSLLAHSGLALGAYQFACRRPSSAIFLLYGIGELTFPFVHSLYCDSEVYESVILSGQLHISVRLQARFVWANLPLPWSKGVGHDKDYLTLLFKSSYYSLDIIMSLDLLFHNNRSLILLSTYHEFGAH